MPVHDIVILSSIVTVFCAFGVVLASVCWYCRNAPHQPTEPLYRQDTYPPNIAFLTDD